MLPLIGRITTPEPRPSTACKISGQYFVIKTIKFKSKMIFKEITYTNS